MHRSFALLFLVCGVPSFVMLGSPLRAGLVIEIHEPIITFGDIVTITEEKWARAKAVVNGPGGGMQEVATHDGSPAEAEFTVTMDGRTKAKAKAFADPGSQKSWHMWVVDETDGWNVWNGNGTMASIEKKVTTNVVTVPTGIIIPIWISIDPFEEFAAFFGPQVEGGLEYNLRLTEMNSGEVLIDSTTQFQHNSPDNVIDDQELLHWFRAPGILGQDVPADLGTMDPFTFSDNRWVLDPATMIALEVPVELQPGESVDLKFALESSTNNGFSQGTSQSIFGLVVNEFLPEVIPGDFNFDGTVNLIDFNILKTNFGLRPADSSQGDANMDGTVNLLDFNILKTNFGAMVPIGVPEPNSIVLAGIALSALVGIVRCRRR